MGSGVRVKWLCGVCGNEWFVAVGNRSAKKGTGCPPCAFARRGRHSAQPRLGQSLTERAPGLAAQWHPTKNGDVRPSQVAAHSNIKRWWQCPVCEYAWSAAPGSRMRGNGCGACAGRRPTPMKNLATCHPEVAAWWHPSKNGTLTAELVTPGECATRWWLCPHGHEWQTTVYERVSGTGCPKCSGWGTSRREQQILAELRAAEWPLDEGSRSVSVAGRPDSYRCDAVITDWGLIVEYDGWRYHKTPKQLERDRVKTAKLQRAGWLVIRIREEVEPISDSDVVVPIVKDENRVPELVIAPVLARAADLGIKLPINSADYLKNYVRDGLASSAYIPGRPPKGRSFAELQTHLLTEWHPTKNLPMAPELLTARSGFRAWWICTKCRYEWKRAVAARTGGSGCPNCAGQVTHRGNNLARQRPDLAAQWHPTRNGDLKPKDVHVGSGKRVWWLCDVCAHSWRTQPYRRSHEGTGCPKCARRGLRRRNVDRNSS